MLGSKHSCKMRGALVVGTRKMSWLEFINSKKSVQFLVQAVLLCKKRLSNEASFARFTADSPMEQIVY